MNNGWIKLHRKITSHWIWSKPEYFQWWIDILMEVNYESNKVLIKGIVFNCNRGECLYSYDTWASRWKTNKSKAMRFLKMLEKDSMILIKNETVTTRITVCKYDSYQDIGNDIETQVKRKRNADETQVKPTKEEKNEKNIEEEKNEVLTAEFLFNEFKRQKGMALPFFDRMIKVYQVENIIDSFQKWYLITQGKIKSINHAENSFRKYLESEIKEKENQPEMPKKHPKSTLKDNWW